MINNRQAGRRRGRGNNNGGGNGGGGGGPRQGGGGGGQRDTGNRIDSRARGNATQLYEKYKNLARDAQMQGDRVNIEYYLQFADHYFRVLSEQRTRLEESQPQHAPRPRIQQPFDINGDDDYADEGEPIRAGEQQGEQGNGQSGQGNGQSQNGGQRQDRDDRPRYDSQRNENRQRDGQRDGQRDDRPRNERQSRDDRGARDEQPRNEARDDQSRDAAAEPQQREARGEYRDAPARTPRAPRMAAPVQADDAADQSTLPLATPVTDQGDTPDVAAAATEDKPRRRGRPPRDRSAEDASGAIADADRLPASLGISAAAAPAPASAGSDGEGEEKPRRRRIRTAASEVQAG